MIEPLYNIPEALSFQGREFKKLPKEGGAIKPANGAVQNYFSFWKKLNRAEDVTLKLRFAGFNRGVEVICQMS